jgi:hypothetical protein
MSGLNVSVETASENKEEAGKASTNVQEDDEPRAEGKTNSNDEKQKQENWSRSQKETFQRNGTDVKDVKGTSNDTTSGHDGQTVEAAIQPELKLRNEAKLEPTMDPLENPKDVNHDRDSHEKAISGGHAQAPLQKQGPNRSSLDALTQWASPGALQAEASQVSLPPSTTSSKLSLDNSKARTLPPGHSLEQLVLHPEDFALPKTTTKRNPADQRRFMRGAAGEPSTKKKKKKKKDQPPMAKEVLAYRSNVKQLDAHFPNFHNIAVTTARHDWTPWSEWSPRIVIYDRIQSSLAQATKRQEPWKGRTSTPFYGEFSSTLRNVPDDCIQRIILVEDLTPLVIDLLGATFQIPPHVFEEHLDRSGYRPGGETNNRAAAWHTRSSAQGYSSVTWYRPVRPIIRTSGYRSRLVNNQTLNLPCPYEGCRNHRLNLSTLANIWRRNLRLCPDPRDRQTEEDYPVGWEERATIWSRELEDCKFVIVLLDPLPLVIDKSISSGATRTGPADNRHQRPTLANLWLKREEKLAKARGGRTQGPSQDQHIDDWIPPPPPGSELLPTTSPPVPPPPPGAATEDWKKYENALSSSNAPPRESRGAATDDPTKNTGSKVENTEASVPPLLRRRTTRSIIGHPNAGDQRDIEAQRTGRLRNPTWVTPPPPTPPPPHPPPPPPPPPPRHVLEPGTK